MGKLRQSEARSALLLFDLDGTLVSSGGSGRRAITRVLRGFGVNGNVVKKYDWRGKTDPQIFDDCINLGLGRKATLAEHREFLRIYPKFLGEELKRSPSYRMLPGVKDFIRRLRRLRGAYLALGTGNLEAGARLKLAPAQLNRYFPVGGFSSDAADRGRLIHLAVLKARRYYGVRFQKGNVFVIGDTPLDVRAARANGYRSVVVACGFGKPHELKAAKPDFYFDDYADPKAWIEALGLQDGM
ncbi:MAG: haloacid dehalogenase-like hydrolase [Elusimicrobia bacterium]|nr:haloacid dehalogenase-like hydrolase [Elusimicrobiota bacterium]